MDLMFSFYEGVLRKAPGSTDSTLKALSMLEGLPASPRIVEFGCGAGVASLTLARNIPCRITAVDIHQAFLVQLAHRAAGEGFGDRITAVQADMGNPPFPDESFDVVWSEGAIYNIGFQDGLCRWRRLIQTGGFVAVSDAVWLTEDPPRKAREFWAAEYPAMTTVEQNLSMLNRAGFSPMGHFLQPTQDWENYYLPLESHLSEFRQKHLNDAAADNLIRSVRNEIDMWREFGTNYGYAFFVGRAV